MLAISKAETSWWKIVAELYIHGGYEAEHGDNAKEEGWRKYIFFKVIPA